MLPALVARNYLGAGRLPAIGQKPMGTNYPPDIGTLADEKQIDKAEEDLIPNEDNTMSENNALTLKSYTPEALIAQGIQSGLTVETMKELLAMRRELKAEKAKEDFDKAMAQFQSECPVIKKAKKVKFDAQSGGVNYAYAPLDSIVSQVSHLIAKNGFSYSFKIEESPKGIKATCVIKHIAGHSDTSDFTADLSGTKAMSMAQVTASKATYAKRQAFCNAFGITTGDDDIDAMKTKAEAVAETAATDEQKIEINDLAQQLGMTASEITKRCQEKYGVSFTKITSVQAEGIIGSLKQRIAKLGN